MKTKHTDFILRNVRIMTPGRTDVLGFVHVENGKFHAVGEGDAYNISPSLEVIDGQGHRIAPGFIDMHVHGADGADVMDGTVSSLESIAIFHARHGTTGFLPTTLTASVAQLRASMQAARDLQQLSYQGASVLGVHLEGPFIERSKKGAQNPDYIQNPVVDAVATLLDGQFDLVKKITIAPDVPNAVEAITWLTSRGVIASLGHSDATYACAHQAILAGASHATHLFNAMRGIHHRDGGLAGACLLHDEVLCELIADGHHVAPEMMQLAVRLKGKDRLALITDAIAATGKPDGEYQLGGLKVSVHGEISLLEDGKTLAGSTLTLDRAVKNMVEKVGVDLSDALYMASTTPANALGYGDCKGRIEQGFDADFVVLDEQLRIVATYVDGREIYRQR